MSQVSNEAERFGDLAEASARLGVSPSTLSRLLKRDNPPPSLKLGGKRKFPLNALDQWRDSQITGRTGPAVG